MKKILRALTATLASIVFCSSGALGADHACKPADIIHGAWIIKECTEVPALREATWCQNFPYQYISFRSDSSYSYLASAVLIKTPDKLFKLMRWPEGIHTLRYLLDDNGTLDLYLDKTLKYHYRCTISESKNGKEMTLNGYSRKGGTQIWGHSQIYRVYRRWF